MAVPRNNHYIPQFYTARWKFNDRQVYYLDKKQSKIIITSPRNIFADRIWNPEVEGTFTQFENKFWIPVIDKILKNKTMELSERDLESFLSFFLTLKVRTKKYVVESYEIAASNLAKFDNELIKDGKATKEQIEELNKIYKNPSLLDYSFLSSHTPASLFKEESPHNDLKKLTFGTRIIQEQDMQHGQFVTSDYPSQMFNKDKICLLMMIALAPNLLVFGAREIETFMGLNNKPIDAIIKSFNNNIYNSSEHIISNKKSLLEQFV